MKLHSDTQPENDKFKALFQYASMGILLADEQGIIQDVNQFLLQQFCYESASELTGKKIEVLIPLRYHRNHNHYREKYAQHPEPRVMGSGRDLFGVRKDGSEIPVEISLSNYENDERKYTIAFISDITKRKQSESAVQFQKEQLAIVNTRIEQLNNELEKKVLERTRELEETMEKLELSRDELSRALSKEKELSDLKSRFVSMASHEFRTPLSTILSSASLLARYTTTEEQEKRDKHIHRIKSSVNNLTGILNEFLSIGKIEDGKIIATPSTFNLKEMLQAACNELQTMAVNGQTIHYLHEGDEMVHLDATILHNIVLNLLSNALKFTTQNGWIQISAIVTENNLNITVKDNGIGISEEDQQHLFERFFRAKNAVNIQGTGLGLHIVMKYVEILNGNIHWESILEKGTTFTITIPLLIP